MNFILDTCVLIWFFEGSSRIRSGIKNKLVDPSHSIFMSDVSVLEVVIKYQLGKFPLPKAPSRILPILAKKHFIDSLPIDSSAIYELENLPPIHRDPFDRLLIAQTISTKFTLVSPDPMIHRYDVSVLWE